MWDGSPFNGTKIALLNAGAVLAYLRDDKDGIPWRVSGTCPAAAAKEAKARSIARSGKWRRSSAFACRRIA
jgi:hypothetical protein